MKGIKYPLLFTYRDILAGNGFIAGVCVQGRSLMVEDEEGVWIYGVHPGGISAGGASQREAANAFREMSRKVLLDIAIEAATFDELKSEVGEFFNDTNDANLRDWWKAVDLVRRGIVSSNWLEKEKADAERGVEVVELALKDDEARRKPEPSFNYLEHDSLAA